MAGSAQVGAGTGTGLAFNFRFVDAGVSFAGGRSVITAPDGSRTDVTGVGTLTFTDGVIQERDENPLVDDLFYDARNLDVWAAHIDPEMHYATSGFREGRDPDAYFSTRAYLAAYPDVAASGIDPLAQYDQSGWREGRTAGLSFSASAYLAAYPDVAAAHVDPLAHYLTYGAAEGRQAFPVQRPGAGGSFDAAYYLAHNPDVAAAGVDPYQHYETFGAREGRNPNAYFDTRGYLAAYPDVAAAGVNPLDHFDADGWREGRNPSPAFDARAYLAAYPDVAAAGIDPLTHYLRYGLAEGRTAFALPLVDADGAANAVAPGAASGSGTGVTASWGGFVSPDLVYSLLADSSGGGFAVDPATGRVTVGDASRDIPGQSYSVTVRASDDGFSLTQTFTIAVAGSPETPGVPGAPGGPTPPAGPPGPASPVAPPAPPFVPVDADATANGVPEGAAAGTYTGLTVSATPTAGTTVRYSLTGDTSGGGFAVNVATGAVTVADPTKLDYETGGASHSYGVTVQASDGVRTSAQTFAIGISDVAPTTPADNDAAANTVPENAAAGTTVGVTAFATDVNGPAVRYSLAGDTSGGGFAVNATTGVVTVADPAKLDYETSGAGHSYGVTVQASDGTLTSARTFTIAVSDVNEAPVVTSAPSASEAENTPAATVVYTAQATDPDTTAPNNTLTYSLGGADAGLFTINPATGAVTFNAAPDHENPADANHDNVYAITVTATDGGNPALSGSRAVNITVTDVNDTAPVFTSSATPSVAENTTAIVSLTTTDADTVGTNPPVFTITGGADAAQFQIANGNQLQFVSPHDYETQAHSYAVQVTANDGANTTVQALSVALTDVNDTAPVFTSSATPNVAENTTAVVSLTTTDADTVGTSPPVFTITGGADAAQFQIVGGNQLQFVSPHDYETQAHSYAVQVTASDGANTTVQALSVALTDVNDTAPVFTSSATPSVTENTTAIVSLTTTDADTVGTNPPVFTITGGADAAQFQIVGGNQLQFVSPHDYETQAHSYAVQVTASDGANPTVQALSVALTDLPPSIPVDGDGSPNQTVNGAGAGASTGVTASSTDPAGGTVTYALLDASGAAADAGGRFTIDATTGVVTVSGNTPIVYDATPGATNTYTIGVRASDPSGVFQSQTFAIAVNADAPPTITSNGAGDTAATSVAENATAVTTVTATDPDNGPSPISYTISSGADAAKFQIDSTSGALSFITAPDFEAPGSAAGTNAYVVQVGASDGALADLQTITVTVTNVNEAPTPHPDAAASTEAGGVSNGTAGVNPTFNVLTGTGETIATGADTDPDAGDALSVRGVAAGTTNAALTTGAGTDIAGTYGTIHINADGSATYTVDNANTAVAALRTASQTLTDTFSYTAKDSGGLTATTTATITIQGANDAPVAVNDTSASPGAVAATEAGGTSNGTAGANATGTVLANDTDADSAANGETRTVQGVEAGSHPSDTVTTGTGTGVVGTYGTVTVAANGSYTYVVNDANATVQALNVGQHVTDTFTYTMHDAAGATSTATLAITINGADDAPVAVPDGSSASPIAVSSGSQTTYNLLANDSDVDGPALTAVADGAGPGHGTVVVNANGTFTYTASNGYVGADSFTYHASDGTLSSNSATVSVTVAPNIAYIDNSSASATQDGSFANPYHSIAAFNTANTAANNYAIVYVEKGTGTGIYSDAALSLRAGQTLEGQGVDPSYTDGSGNTVTVRDLTNGSANTPTLQLASASAVLTLSTGNTLRGINVTNTGTGAGIADNGGTVGTLTLSDVGIRSASGTGLSLTNGGTVTATTADGANTIQTTSGTALNVSNTTIGSGNLTFQSITAGTSAGSTANGIILSSTGTAGGLHVTGTGTTAGSGGTIQHITGADQSTAQGTGIFLTNTANVQLANMQLNDFSNFAIRANAVSGLTIDHTVISGTNGSSSSVTDTLVGSTVANGEDAVRLTNLTGTNAVTYTTISGGNQDGLHVENTSGTLTNLTIDHDTVTGRTGGNDAVNVLADNSGVVMTVTATNNTFAHADSNLFSVTGQQGTTIHVTATGNALTANSTNAVAGGNAGISVASLGSATYDVETNTFDSSGGGANVKGTAITIYKGSGSGSSTFAGTIAGNTIGVGGVPNSGGAAGISVSANDQGTSTVLIQNNTLTNQFGGGIQVVANNSTTVNATVYGNSVSQPGSQVFSGFDGESGGGTLNLKLGGTGTQRNDFSAGDPTDTNDVFLATGSPGAVHLTQGSSASTDVTTTVQANNLNPGATTVGVAGSVNVVTTAPPTPQLAAPGGVQAAAATPGETRLTQAQLSAVVAAAIGNWAAAGATAAQLALLAGATYTVADLSGTTLGQESSGHVTIDSDAAGYGWYVDPAPGGDAAFPHAANVSGSDLLTDPTLAPAGHYDLLTTVLHEMGHVIGLVDSSAPTDANDVMNVNLAAGERRLPVAADVAAAATAAGSGHAAAPSAAAAATRTGSPTAEAPSDHAGPGSTVHPADGTDRAGSTASADATAGHAAPTPAPAPASIAVAAAAGPMPAPDHAPPPADPGGGPTGSILAPGIDHSGPASPTAPDPAVSGATTADAAGHADAPAASAVSSGSDHSGPAPSTAAAPASDHAATGPAATSGTGHAASQDQSAPASPTAQTPAPDHAAAGSETVAATGTDHAAAADHAGPASSTAASVPDHAATAQDASVASLNDHAGASAGSTPASGTDQTAPASTTAPTTGSDQATAAAGADHAVPTAVAAGAASPGPAGADSFAFNPSSFTAAPPAHAADDGAAQGHTIDLSALLSGMAPDLRVSEAAGGGSATVQVHQGDHWTDLAHLDGVHAGDGVTVVFDPAHAGLHLSASLFA